MAQFIVIGDATVDQMYFVEEFPELGGEAIAQRSSMEPGGAGGTIAIALTSLGHQVRISTRVGKGPFADLALRNLRQAKVDLSLVQYDDELQTSSVTLIISGEGQRTMLSSAGASRQLDASQLKADDIKSCDALVLSAYSLISGKQRDYAIQAFNHAREGRLTTFMDMGSGAVDLIKGNMFENIKGLDFLLMNEHELFRLTNEDNISSAVKVLNHEGIEGMIIKLGAFGSMVVTPQFQELVEAFHIDEVVDTTGAGDYYTAAFAHGIMKGYDVLYAARLGNVAGALNATKVGAQSYPIDAAKLEYLAKGFNPT
ncbi:MAG: carbohydrate kinase family protein [Deinococcales bacterium]